MFQGCFKYHSPSHSGQAAQNNVHLVHLVSHGVFLWAHHERHLPALPGTKDNALVVVEMGVKKSVSSRAIITRVVKSMFVLVKTLEKWQNHAELNYIYFYS